MDDICFLHFVLKSCPTREWCGKAHSFEELCNLQSWVLFRGHHFSVNQYLIVQQLGTDRHYPIPSQGSLVRCRTPENARTILAIYQGICVPLSLATAFQNVESNHCPREPSHVQPLAESILQCDSVSDDEVTVSNGSFGSNANPLLQPTPGRLSLSLPDEAFGTIQAISEVPRLMSTSIAARFSFPAKTSKLEGVSIPGLSVPMDDGIAHQPPKPKKSSKKEVSADVIHMLRTEPSLRSSYKAGWEALRRFWGIQLETIDPTVLVQLAGREPERQEQILLAFAAIGLSSVQNVSAYLSSLIKDHETNSQVCIFFLAGVCQDPACTYIHPHRSPMWDLLEQRWGCTYKDLDYPVLNYLCKKPPGHREAILQAFADINLGDVQNWSAYLSSMVHKQEKRKARRGLSKIEAASDFAEEHVAIVAEQFPPSTTSPCKQHPLMDTAHSCKIETTWHNAGIDWRAVW
eukprot:GGOE01009150.1.p1 GENE.GGOE01009150.1~~GGOE01009150.1.p1  ORF type:complete len:470 (-),score=62.68 GGOE01009150.1:1318-2700(-)